MRAVTGPQFEWITMDYFMRKTGIPFNFGITVALGFIVGTAIAGADVLLVHDREHQAVRGAQGDGAGNLSLMSMILLQARRGELHRLRAGHRHGDVVWQDRHGARLAAGVLHAVGSVRRRGHWRRGDQRAFRVCLSMQRVMVVEPAVVFQG